MIEVILDEYLIVMAASPLVLLIYGQVRELVKTVVKVAH